MRSFLEDSDDVAKSNICSFAFSDLSNVPSYNPVFDMRSGMNWQEQVDQILISK